MGWINRLILLAKYSVLHHRKFFFFVNFSIFDLSRLLMTVIDGE